MMHGKTYGDRQQTHLEGIQNNAQRRDLDVKKTKVEIIKRTKKVIGRIEQHRNQLIIEATIDGEHGKYKIRKPRKALLQNEQDM